MNVHRDASVLTPTHSYCHPRAVDSLSATLDTRTHEMTGARQKKRKKKKEKAPSYLHLVKRILGGDSLLTADKMERFNK